MTDFHLTVGAALLTGVALGAVFVICRSIYRSRRAAKRPTWSYRDAFNFKPTNLQNATQLLGMPAEHLDQLDRSRHIGTAKIISFVLAHFLGKESDYKTFRDGSYQLSRETRARLGEYCIYRRTTDGWGIVTDRRLNDESTYQFLGRVDAFWYSNGLLHTLKRDFMMMNDWMTEEFRDLLDH